MVHQTIDAFVRDRNMQAFGERSVLKRPSVKLETPRSEHFLAQQAPLRRAVPPPRDGAI